MALTLVQSKHKTVGTGDPATATFDSNVTAGNLIDVVCGWTSPGDEAPGTCTDGLSNTYTEITNCRIRDAGNGQSMGAFYAKNITGGACTVSVDFPGSASNTHLTITEWSGGDTTAPLDQSTGQVQSGTSAPSSSAITPGANGELILSSMQDVSVGSVTITPESTAIENAGGTDGIFSQYETQATAASISGDFSLSASRDTLCIVRTYKVAGASATLEQEGYRIRNDDGSESAASWKAAQDTAVSMTLGAARVRVLLDATNDPVSKAVGLKYAVNGGQKRSVN